MAHRKGTGIFLSQSGSGWSVLKGNRKGLGFARAHRRSKDVAPGLCCDPIRAERRIGRNEPCPCGSGRKFKKCCGGT
jgi:hypothetical protein